MSDGAPPALIADLLAFVGEGGRPLSDVLDAWRTSCPRLPIWETVLEEGLVAIRPQVTGPIVELTEKGRQNLPRPFPV